MMAGMVGELGTAVQAPANTAALSRKIIYDGEVALIVKDVDPIAKQVVTFIQDARGYIAEQSTTGSPGSQRSMRWKLHVPVDQFESLVQKVVALGELEQNKRTSQDVTEQFYDIEAHIKNKKAEEKSLTKILDERTGKLEDVLRIETELSRVRGEIEQLEGKIRVLENLSSLATLTLSVREREKFEPPPPAAADFPTQVARTWENSLRGLIDLGKAFILWAVDWVLWIPLLIVGGLLAWVILRRLFRLLPGSSPWRIRRSRRLGLREHQAAWAVRDDVAQEVCGHGSRSATAIRPTTCPSITRSTDSSLRESRARVPSPDPGPRYGVGVDLELAISGG